MYKSNITVNSDMKNIKLIEIITKLAKFNLKLHIQALKSIIDS